MKAFSTAAKQLAARLGASPGTVGHHLHVLEDAGLAQIVARRVVRGIVAKYYTRTARIFDFDLPVDIIGQTSVEMNSCKKNLILLDRSMI